MVLTSGQNSINNNFGELKPVTISGNVYEDKLGTGALAPGDSPIPGTTLTLTASGATIATTITAVDGTYSFTFDSNGNPLTPGTYKITETQPAGLSPGNQYRRNRQRRIRQRLIPVDMIGSMVLTSGQASVSNNFGELKPVTISGNVYEDMLGTGVLAPGDSPIPGPPSTLSAAALPSPPRPLLPMVPIASHLTPTATRCHRAPTRSPRPSLPDISREPIRSEPSTSAPMAPWSPST